MNDEEKKIEAPVAKKKVAKKKAKKKAKKTAVKSTEWSEEQKQAASEGMVKRSEAAKMATTRAKTRVPIGQKRDITTVHDTPEGFKDRWVNDSPGRLEKFKQAGYELVPTAEMGSSSVDGSHAENGTVSKDMGKGQTAYLMRQRQEYYDDDQSAKQKSIDETENGMRKKNVEAKNSEDGTYGKVHIG